MITDGEREWRQRFVGVLKREMKAQGLMQKEVAAEAGLPASSISHYLTGNKTPNFYAVLMLSEALNVKLTEFV